MVNISSNWTAFLKFFLPTIWIVFFGTLSIAFLFTDLASVAGMPISTFRIVAIAFFLTGTASLYWLVMRLKRVEMDENYLYVTNYRRNFRYPYQNIAKIEELDYLIFRTLRIHFIKPGHFGKRVSCIANIKRLNRFLKDHPQIAALLAKEDKE